MRDLKVLPRCEWDTCCFGSYAAYICSHLPRFRDNLSVPSSSAAWPLKMGPNGCPETSVTINLRWLTSGRPKGLSRLTLYTEKDKLCGQNAAFHTVTACGTILYHCALKGWTSPILRNTSIHGRNSKRSEKLCTCFQRWFNTDTRISY